MIHILYLVCSRGHDNLASAWDTNRMEYNIMAAAMMAAPAILGVELRCDICGSTQFHLEDRSTRFATMEEAEASLAERSRRRYESRTMAHVNN